MAAFYRIGDGNMRKSILSVTIILALQGYASHASAADVDSAKAVKTEIASVTLDKPRAQLQQGRVQASNAQEQKTYAREAEAKSNNFASPKPVRVYFFFGGR